MAPSHLVSSLVRRVGARQIVIEIKAPSREILGPHLAVLEAYSGPCQVASFLCSGGPGVLGVKLGLAVCEASALLLQHLSGLQQRYFQKVMETGAGA